jgi:predicted nucleotidyltransferase
MEAELDKEVKKYPVEVRVLNNAPLSFRYNVLKHGKPIVVVDDDLRCDFMEATLSNYFDFAPFRKMYLKEAMGSGI